MDVLLTYHQEFRLGLRSSNEIEGSQNKALIIHSMNFSFSTEAKQRLSMSEKHITLSKMYTYIGLTLNRNIVESKALNQIRAPPFRQNIKKVVQDFC